MGLAGVVLCTVLSSAIEAKERGAVWRQTTGFATETVFLRRGAAPLIPADDMPSLTAGDLIRTRPFLHVEPASMTAFTRSGTGDTIEIYPGSVLALVGDAVRLDLGRMRLIASGGTGLSVDIRRGIVEIPEGELVLETDPTGDVTLALRRGTGWIKMEDRAVRKLTPGKQYNIPKYGTMGKPVETGRIWDGPPAFWKMPQPPPRPADDDESDETTASGTGELASETVNLATGTDTLAPQAGEFTEGTNGIGSGTSSPASGPAWIARDGGSGASSHTDEAADIPNRGTASDTMLPAPVPVEQPVSGE